MTIENLYPSQRPDIIYNPLNGPLAGPASSVFSRASGGRYWDALGVLRTAEVNELRPRFDPVTGEYLGLMLEDYSKNVAQGSNSFDDTAYYSRQSAYIGVTPSQPSPDGNNNAFLLEQIANCSNNQSKLNTRPKTNSVAAGAYIYSVRVKLHTPSIINVIGFSFQTNKYSDANGSFGYLQHKVTFDNDGKPSAVTGAPGGYRHVGNGWYEIWVYLQADATQDGSGLSLIVGEELSQPFANYGKFLIYERMLEPVSSAGLLDKKPSSIITTTSSEEERQADSLSFIGLNGFDAGFSVLLDTQAEPGAAVYKVRSNGSEIASLANDAGTLKWEIDGVSAQSSNSYPQIGFPSGRVKTVSGFGPSGQGSVENFLYTTGIQFPTAATPASGADEIELLGPQTVKALYVWEGQLDEVKAVSLIKGRYRLVTNAPIAADSYSFVYDSDPTSTANASVSLPYISPTVSMTVDWGDVSSDAYEQGVIASHDYSNSGKYRIQIEADDGFDSARLADVDDTILRVDQWAPQHRPGAAGDGFAGADLIQFLELQGALEFIPPFKYTNLTSLEKAFYGCDVLEVNGFNWVPYELPVCTSLSDAFNGVSANASDQTPQNLAAFPQLETSSSLLDAYQVFANTAITGFVDSNGTPTDQPFTDSSQVTGWTRAFANTSLTSLNVDTSSALALVGTFSNGAWIQSPVFNSPFCANFQNVFDGCRSMIEMHPSVPSSSFASGTNFSYSWRDCESLASFPLLDTSSATLVNYAWQNCGSIDNMVAVGATTSFPLLDLSAATTLQSAWNSCASLQIFPLINTGNCSNFRGSWYYCSSLQSFPAINTSKATRVDLAWRGCSGLQDFPALDFSLCGNFTSAWLDCSNLASFPAGVFNVTGTLASTAFLNAFTGCDLDVISIENILVSLDTNGQTGIDLSLDGGTNEPKTAWTQAANTAYSNLTGKGWTIDHN